MRRDAASSLLLTCDHASKDVPHALKQLGLAPAELQRHIGWDIGAAAVTRRLAPLLDAPAILAGYSRLVIDCNRDPGDPSSIPEASDGTAIPGNHGLGAEERALRHAAIFAPYHGAIEDGLETRIARGLPHVAIELRQDLVADDAGATRWAEILAATLRPILARQEIYAVRRG